MIQKFKYRFSKLLKESMLKEIPKLKERVKELQKHSDKVVDTIDVGAVVGGMRELPVMFYIGSQLCPQSGIRFRGLSIPEMQKELPKIEKEPLPEAVFWLLLTGRAPNKNELDDLTKSMVSKESLPQSTIDLIKNYSKNHHPMTILSMATLDLQKNSDFAKSYSTGSFKKVDYWQKTLDDGLLLLNKVFSKNSRYH